MSFSILEEDADHDRFGWPCKIRDRRTVHLGIQDASTSVKVPEHTFPSPESSPIRISYKWE